MILNSDAQICIIGGAAGCFGAAAQFLTPKGWIRFDEYKKGMKIAEYSTDTDTIKFKQPNEYVKLPCDSLTMLKGKGMQMTLSDEHTVLYWNMMRGGVLSPPQTLPYSEVKERHNKSKTKGWTGKIKTTFKVEAEGLGIPEGELRLQVAVKADGCISPAGKDNYTAINVSKERKYLRILELCKKFNLRYSDRGWKANDQYSNGRLYTVIVWPESSEKRYSDKWYKCSQEELNIIADESPHWDGTIVKGNKTDSYRYFSKYKSDCDFMQYAFASQGMNTSVVHDHWDEKFDSWTTNGSMFGGGFRSFANKDRKNELVDVPTDDGYKYCFNTDSGFLLVREENKIYLSGNSGKSYLLQMLPLRYTDDPKTTVIMFRRTTPQIRGQGGIFDTACNMYEELDDSIKPKIKHSTMEAAFPSGATMKWSHMEHIRNKLDIQGLQFTLIGVDEACQFEWEQLEYMMSRLRSESKYPSRMVMSCNPDSDHKIRELIDWHLDEDGYPIPERDGVLRYFLRRDGDFFWGATREELGIRFDIPEKDWEVNFLSFTFISATIYDNPPMMKSNPEYKAFLEGLGPVDKAQLLHGNWNVRAEGANYFKRDRMIKVLSKPLDAVWARGWDKASQEPTTTEKHPDFTAGVKLGKDRHGFYYLVGDYDPDNKQDDLTDIYGRFQKRAGERDKIIAKQGHYDGEECVVVLPIDPAAAGKVEYAEAAKKLLGEGIRCQPDPVPNNKNKLAKFAPFADAVEAGLVRVVESSFPNKQTLNTIYDELEKFDGERSTRTKKDDLVDSIATAFNFLTLSRSIKVVKRNQTRVDTLAKGVIDMNLPKIGN